MQKITTVYHIHEASIITDLVEIHAGDCQHQRYSLEEKTVFEIQLYKLWTVVRALVH